MIKKYFSLSFFVGVLIFQSCKDDGSVVSNCPGVIDCAGVCNGSATEDCAAECGGLAVVDECGECNGDGSTCQDPSYYNVDIEWTGASQLVIFQPSISGLEPGDQIGIFDSNAIIDNTGTTGELLVGPVGENGAEFVATWSGNQLEPVAIGAVDLSEFGGPILPGYQQGSSVVVKVYRPSTGIEYDTELTYSAGTGTFGDLFIAISEILILN